MRREDKRERERERGQRKRKKNKKKDIADIPIEEFSSEETRNTRRKFSFSNETVKV